MLNLDLLLVFIAVAENSSFTRAASELNRSQSAISMQIKRLEEMLGVTVFERAGKNVKLSPEGNVLLGYARRILRLMNEAVGAVSKKAEGKSVRLGCIEDYAARILPKVLVNFWTAHPEVHIEVDTGETSDLLKKLGDEYDMVLAMHMMPNPEGIFLRMDRLVWATSPAHSPHEADPVPLALRPEGCLESEWATAALDTALRPWRSAFVSAGIGTLQGAVEEGLAISMFKESTLPSSLRILTSQEGFPELPSVGICLHVAAGSSIRPDVTLLSEALIQSLKPREPD